ILILVFLLLPRWRRGRLVPGRRLGVRLLRRRGRRDHLLPGVFRRIADVPGAVPDFLTRWIGAAARLAAASGIGPEDDEVISIHLAAAHRFGQVVLRDPIVGDRVTHGPADLLDLHALVDDAVVDVGVVRDVLGVLDERDVARR